MADANDCPAGSGTAPLSVEAALQLLLESARPISGIETVNTFVARNRVLAEALVSPVDLPCWDNSAMDGYAVNTGCLAAHQGRLRVAQRIPAGSCGEPLAAGTAARIFTGAPVPNNADAVVVQEICERDGDWVAIPLNIKPGANIRRRGEDVHASDAVIGAGTRMSPQHVGLAASVGAEALSVRRRLRVAILASGDELVMPGEPLGPGRIYNSNRFVYHALLDALGCDLIDLGIVADTLEATVDALSAAAEQADLVLASGGVSVGEEDHVRPAMQALGTLDLWRIAMRPGKPLAFGHIGETPFIGSPGNPVSMFVTFCLFVRPFILRMQGVAGDLLPLMLPARAGFDWPAPDKRREYQRARLERGSTGETLIRVFQSRSSAALTSLTWANGVVVIPEGHTITAGDAVDFIPFSELMT
ncbi:MAG: gephyrin-like molybdotransferase Glp [Thiohalocapsa sp.]